MATTRILIAIDVETDLLSESYGESDLTDGPHARDLQDTIAARLNEFYPANDGYVTVAADKVVVAVVNDSTPLTSTILRGAYEVGVEGAEDDDEDGCDGHESTDGPIGNTVYCDGTCKPHRA